MNDGAVTLGGQLHRPSLRKSAERVALQVEGVSSVANNIEILPVSFRNNRIRLAVARSIFTNSALDAYGLQPNPPIHLIVRNGDVTLEGVVNREMERSAAAILANGAPGAFSITNNLRLDPK